MKKFIFVLALMSLAAAAFADFDVTWSNRTNIQNGDDLGFTDRLTSNDYNNGTYSVAAFGNVVGDWLINPNDVISISVSGLEDLDWSDWGTVDNAYLRFTHSGYVGADLFFDSLATADNFFANGVTLTGAEFLSLTEIPSDAVVKWVDFFLLSDGNSSLPGVGVDYSLRFSITAPQPDTPETEVPEPASAAYALIGLAPVFGLKRRIKK